VFARDSAAHQFPPTAYHSATLVGDLIWVFGGRTASNTRTNEVYVLNMAKQTRTSYKLWCSVPFKSLARVIEWTNVGDRISGTPPAPRQRHTATLVRTNEIWIVGGISGTKAFNDVIVLSKR
jgi:hypothetical protein